MRNSPWFRLVLLGLVAAPATAAEIWTDIGSHIAKFDSANPNVISYVGGNTGELPMDGMDFTSDGVLYAVADQELFIVNQTNGTVQSIGVAQLAPNEIFMDISWNPVTQTMYGVGLASLTTPPHLYQINLGTGAATLVGDINVPLPSIPSGLATTAQGVRYMDDGERGGLYRLQGLDGTFLGPEGLSFAYFGGMTIDWSRDGALYQSYFNSTTLRTELWTADLNTGVGTFLGTVGGGEVITLSVAIKPVPEPTGWLALVVLAGCGIRGRRP